MPSIRTREGEPVVRFARRFVSLAGLVALLLAAVQLALSTESTEATSALETTPGRSELREPPLASEL